MPTVLRATLWVGVLAGMTLLCGCRQPADTQPDARIDCRVAPDPPVVGPATVTLTLTGADGQPLTGAEVAVEGNMAHAGMKPVFGTAREQQPGQYQAPLEFTMGGDWFLIVTATFPDGRKLERQIDIRGVKPR